ncbi:MULTISPECIES: sulfite exporter TauE/SafE family protein [unclassified Sedimentibacter]|uniref:sulfite exporter TauE/SafE family protein n=1 Tax=unclassified Sedimentibacter TaxID=2649220 RepID=UPI0027E18424|nr:sulfite exporter TauE/SafE family protein [Sedimentibacter sp. MB35-C1]WMJ78119.1 sulfite exporter TauE/SafE family protein [Sedimentibacter sp. MB35-C1]
MFIFYFLIAFIASTIGAISGIGGGIIIKPVMDAISGLSASTISFMSGCTVLSMALFSFIRGLKGEVKLNYAVSIWLAVGAANGGYIGKSLFSAYTGNIALVQSVMLLIINFLVFIYITNQGKIKTLTLMNPFLCFVIGLLLGMVSCFLGIGGGPINIAVLYYFFSMSPKVTAKNSLFIILFSQVTSFVTTLRTNTVPSFDTLSLYVMCTGGVIGAIAGLIASKKMSNNNVETFFTLVLGGLIMLNTYNVLQIMM